MAVQCWAVRLAVVPVRPLAHKSVAVMAPSSAAPSVARLALQLVLRSKDPSRLLRRYVRVSTMMTTTTFIATMAASWGSASIIATTIKEAMMRYMALLGLLLLSACTADGRLRNDALGGAIGGGAGAASGSEIR